MPLSPDLAHHTESDFYEMNAPAEDIPLRLGDLTIVNARSLSTAKSRPALAGKTCNAGRDPTIGIALSKNHPASHATPWHATGPHRQKRPLRSHLLVPPELEREGGRPAPPHSINHQEQGRRRIATETKLVWRTAPCLDDRLEGHKELLKLDGRSVLVPREKRFWPADEGLQWRAERLRVMDCNSR